MTSDQSSTGIEEKWLTILLGVSMLLIGAVAIYTKKGQEKIILPSIVACEMQDFGCKVGKTAMSGGYLYILPQEQ